MDSTTPPPPLPNNRFPRAPLPGNAAPKHRRSFSESFARLPDDLLLDPDPNSSFPDLHFSTENVPVDFGVGFGGATERKGHRRSGSSSSFEDEFTQNGSDYAKKAMSVEELAELAIIDPKKAKRIVANRQSAARSKERKIRYTGELERRVQTLQTEATTLSAQLALLQRDTTGLTAENRELKLRLQAMEQQGQLREALNEALREEVQRLKVATGQIPNMNGNLFNRGPQPPTSNYYSDAQLLSPLGGHQTQYMHLSQAQYSSNSQYPTVQSPNDSMDLM